MKMKKGDRAFFYHSGEDKAVVGIVEVTRELIRTRPPRKRALGGRGRQSRDAGGCPVTLQAIKAEPKLKDMVLVQEFAAVGAAGHSRRVEARVQDGRDLIVIPGERGSARNPESITPV